MAETFFDGKKGYRISFADLRKLAEDLYPEEKNESGWYRKIYYDLWVKYGKNRTYISLKEYQNHKLIKETKLGYYDNTKRVYIITSKLETSKNIISEWNERERNS